MFPEVQELSIYRLIAYSYLTHTRTLESSTGLCLPPEDEGNGRECTWGGSQVSKVFSGLGLDVTCSPSAHIPFVGIQSHAPLPGHEGDKI